MKHNYVTLASQSVEALAVTRYGRVTRLGTPLGQHWWLLLDPVESGHMGSYAGTSIDLSVRAYAPVPAELRQIVSDAGLVVWGDWNRPSQPLFDDAYGRVVLTAAVCTARRRDAEKKRDLAREDQARHENMSRLKLESTWRTSVAALAAGTLLFSMLDQPGGYYSGMRALLLVLCALLGILVYRAEGPSWPWLSGLIVVALAWNPFFPMRMTRQEWVPWDIAGVIFFILLAFWSKGRLPRNLPIPTAL
ncbi:DUF6804 family protein [Cryobacterium zongtaii]|uniref:DUF6804 family protein n=1 Tax=Cryobacterium zongtaii TaxID=1259217 RepID=UPI001056EB6F|nr:DUF6804 family protein [Cryobacterium zongtaii]